MKFQDLKLQNKIFFAVLTPLSFLFVLVIITVVTINTMLESSRLVDHTHQVLDKTGSLISSAVDMETGMRGFLLTGKEHFLEPYTTGVLSTFKLIEELEETVADNPPQVSRLKSIRSILSRWNRNVALENIKLRREIGQAAGIDQLAVEVAKGEGKYNFDRFRAQIKLFIDRESRRFIKRDIEFDDTLQSISGNFEKLNEDILNEDISHDVTDQAASLLTAAINMETGKRGFLLTGQEEFLAPYHNGEQKFNDLIGNLKIRFASNTAQLDKIRQAETIFRNWKRNAIMPALKLRKQVNTGDKPFSAVQILIGRQIGKKNFDDFRIVVDDIIKAELANQSNLKKDEAEAHRRFKENIKKLSLDENRVSQTNEIIQKGYRLLAAAMDLQRGMRGFLITGKERFLEPYIAGLGRFDTLYDDLKLLVDDNPQQVKTIKNIRKTIGVWINTIAVPLIDLRRKISISTTMEDLAAAIGKEKGKEYFDEFRVALKNFRNVEEGLLSEREIANRRDINLSYLFIGITLLVALGIGSGFAYMVGQGIASPITKLTAVMGTLSEGDTNVEIPGAYRKDEMGRMAETVEEFKRRMIENLTLQAQTEKAKEDLEIQSAELARSNLELENFAYIASHDLKAPLRGISNLSKWIAEDLGDSVDEETSENLELMHSRVERLEGLLDGLLQYSRVGRGDEKPEIVDVGQLISDITAYISPPEGCEVTVNGTLPTLTTEKAPLEQVFRNLIDNAIKHRDQDQIRILISGEEDADYCSFEVRDNGPGIPERFQERVFMMFQTLKPRDDLEASGMGLAMVKKLIEVNGGDINLESDPEDRYSVFRFTWKKQHI